LFTVRRKTVLRKVVLQYHPVSKEILQHRFHNSLNSNQFIRHINIDTMVKARHEQ